MSGRVLACCASRFSITNSCRRSRLYDCMLGYDAIVTMMCMMLGFRREWRDGVEIEHREDK